MGRIFDWLDCVERNGIDHIHRGPNVKRGEINIKCPFCGTADPSHHMGLSLATGFWACWRNVNHRGKSPLRLLVALLRIPYWKARQLAGLDDDYVDPEGFSAAAARVLRASAPTSISDPAPVVRSLRLPAGFELIENRGRSRYHYAYLAETRGFGDAVDDLIEDYLLCYSKTDEQRDRIVLPYIEEGALVAWTGRAIGTTTSIRYKDLEVDLCAVPIKDTLYNHDAAITKGRILVVVEGPFDALKLDFFGKDLGVRAVALSTNSISDEQIYILEEACVNFDRLVFLMDQKKSGLGIVDSMRMKHRVSTIRNASTETVPKGLKDAGAMTPQQALEFSQYLIQRS